MFYALRITVFAALILRLNAVGVGADVPRQSWSDIAAYPMRGLSPLYDVAGRECQQLLAEESRWAVLPRSIDVVHARPDQPPVFEMHSGDHYYNRHLGTDKAIEFTAAQTWDGSFRLLLNARLLARHGDELWLNIDGFGPQPQLFDGKAWSTYRPLGGGSFASDSFSTRAWSAPGQWWLASSSGLYLAEEGTLRRAKIPNWPGGGAEAVLSDAQGRVLTWSEKTTERGAVVGLCDKGQWRSVEVSRNGRWTSAALRADGGAVIAGATQLLILPPAALAKEAVAAPAEAKRPAHAHFAIGDEWFQLHRAPTLSPRGSVLVAATRLRDKQIGLIRALDAGAEEFLEFADATRSQLTALPDECFGILTSTRELLRLGAMGREPQVLAGPDEIAAQDVLLGCDQQGRIYLQRGEAIVALFPAAESAAPLAARRDSDPRGESAHLQAAVDSEQRICWFINPKGEVLKLPPGEEKPVLADDRLTDGELLWPGRDGAMLVARKGGAAALAQSDMKLATGAALVALAEASFRDMLAAAPRNTCDPRVALNDNAGRSRYAAPWIAIGQSLWINDGSRVYRLRAASDETDEIKAEVVSEGAFEMIGPLHDGAILLAKIDADGSTRLGEWMAIARPDSDDKPVRLPPPSGKLPDGGLLERPESCEGPWLLDIRGQLWLHQSFDRVWRIGSAAEWPMLRDFGQPQFESPAGCVWAYHSARVFAGYELADGGSRRSCRPTYSQHLRPIAEHNGGVICLTPVGLARLRIDRDDAERDAVEHAQRIAWGGAPARVVGIAAGRLYLLVENTGLQLVSVDLVKESK